MVIYVNGLFPFQIKLNTDDKKVLSLYEENYNKIVDYIDNQNINSYINFIVDQLFAANKYFNDQEPWKKKNNHERLNTIVYTSLELIRKITLLLYPIMPDTSLKVFKIFNYSSKDLNLQTIKEHDYIKPGTVINKIGILFKKIDTN